MRRLRPRLSVSRLLIVVAIAALALEAELGRRRYRYCQSKAERSTLVEKTHLRMAASHEGVSTLYLKLARDPRQSRRYNEESAALFARAARSELTKARKAADRGRALRQAAFFPWLSIPPEEPEPPGVNRTAQEDLAKN
jgi:hypothetical protein